MASTSSTSSTNNSALASLYGSGSSATGTTTQTSADTKDQFLKMLVAQMKNQDPLNPLDNAAVTSQMAQISTVEGIEKLNATMGKFTESATANAANSTALIGKTILTEGSRLVWDASTKSMQAGIALGEDASRVVVQLYDSGGQVVDTKTFTNQSAGTTTFEWTGTNNSGGTYGAGNYTMRVAAVDALGATVSATPLNTTTVRSVTQGSGAVKAQLADGSSIDITDIRGVF
ncbi:MAG: flagellar hook capping FlgD N-terminal domain-containing protein [Burkholderiaceae bacterium]